METPITLPVQELQVSTYNHPCEDLFHGGRRKDYLDIVVPLFRASMAGDLKAARNILEDHPNYVNYSINENKETPLHVAAAGGSHKFVRYLVDMMSTVDLELQNRDGNTAFCVAAISGDVGVIEIMFKKNPALPNIRGSKNMTPLYLAAFHGNRHVVTFLYDQLMLDRTMRDSWKDDSKDEVLLKCIQANIFDVALRILKDNKKLPQERHVWDMLQVLARKPQVFNKITNLNLLESFLESSDSIIISISKLLKRYSEENDATLLLRLLWKRIMEKPKDVIDAILRGPMIERDGKETYPSQILFIAAKMNNTRFLIELIREYPDLVLKRNEDGHTIFHISVSHRHQDIYCLLNETGSMKNLITPITDKQGNNILHLVGKSPEPNGFNGLMTSHFEINNEISWYQEVEGILPPPCRELKNKAGQTPKELFIENHKDLFSVSMKSMSETINTSMVVAALVCTIGFSVAYAIPGGFDQDTGFPMFLHNKYFMAFVIMDAMSFILSTTSIVLFLIISYAQNHPIYLRPVPIWFAFGQMLLFHSILFLGMAFFLSLLFLYLKMSDKYGGYLVICAVIAFYIFVLTSRGIYEIRAPYKSNLW